MRPDLVRHVNAINDTAKDFQRAERDHMHDAAAHLYRPIGEDQAVRHKAPVVRY